MVANETNRWYTFNITIPARDWFLQRKSEILMNVVGSDSTGTPLPVVKPLQEDEENYVSSYDFIATFSFPPDR